MAVGQFKVKGSPAIGKTNPTALGTLALRGAAKTGLGAQTTGQPLPLKKGQSKKIFGIPMGKQTSKGRQNVAVKKQKVPGV